MGARSSMENGIMAGMQIFVWSIQPYIETPVVQVNGAPGSVSAFVRQQGAGQLAQPHTLFALRIEVVRRQPARQGAPQRRPLGIDNRIPRRVPVSPLVHRGLAEYALE